MITSPRSGCPINRTLEVLGDHWSLLILRDIAAYDRRSFRELLTGSDEGISAPVLSRRLADLTSAGLLSKTEVSRGKQGRYSLTELGIQTIPLLMALADWGAKIDPTTAARKPGFTQSDNDDALSSTMEEVRRRHLATGGESVSTSLD